jgi:hypothetical protein
MVGAVTTIELPMCGMIWRSAMTSAPSEQNPSMKTMAKSRERGIERAGSGERSPHYTRGEAS